MFSCLHSAKVHEGRLGSKLRVSCIPSRNHPINTNKTPRSGSKGWTGRERALEEIQVRPGNEKRQEVLTVKIQQWKTVSVYSYSRSGEGGRKEIGREGQSIEGEAARLEKRPDQGRRNRARSTKTKRRERKERWKDQNVSADNHTAVKKKIPKCNFQVREAGTGGKKESSSWFSLQKKIEIVAIGVHQL